MHIYDVIIVGGGLAGYTAALTAKTLLLDALWLGGDGFGDLPRAEKITNFPTSATSGKELAADLEAQGAREGVVRTPLRADGVYRTGQTYTVAAKDESFAARAVILATGVEKSGGVRGEREFLGNGVSYCAVCDGALYRGKRVAAVLSSAKFHEDAEYLARFAAELTVFCPEEVEGFAARHERAISVEGDRRVEKLITDGGEYPVDGVFFLRNSAPPATLVGGLRTEGAHVVVGRDLSTNLPGVFAAGDVTGRPYQYAKAAGEGCVAAHSVKAYLREIGTKI